ncbi:MAG: type I restriction enzyme HsdR N-terminal domain-containing protein [Clostridia bacterium]|nr:type I restriction enzyme HsdR N-terminal domain-containing protein [Clostridia bacterium]
MVIKHFGKCPTYRSRGKRCRLDRCRGRLVCLAAEEKVRQDVVMTLTDLYGYPLSWISTEVTVQAKPRLRADVVVRAPGEDNALIVVECKARCAELTHADEAQVAKYCAVLQARYMVLTNRSVTKVWLVDQEDGNPTDVEDVPCYSEAVKHRPGLCRLHAWARARAHASGLAVQQSIGSTRVAQQANTIHEDSIVGADSDSRIQALAMDLHGRITQHEPLFADPFAWLGHTAVEDLGVGRRPLGNAGGCSWDSGYRSLLLIDPRGEAHIVRFKVAPGMSWDGVGAYGVPSARTFLNVMVSDVLGNHCSLRLCLDRFVTINSKRYVFFHDGKMTPGNKGRLSDADAMDYVAQHQQTLVSIDGNAVSLGTLPRSRFLQWDKTWEATRGLLANLAVYAILRDDLKWKTRRRKRRRRLEHT